MAENLADSPADDPPCVRGPRRRRSARRGASMVEAAVVMPLAALLLVGAIDLTWVFVLRHTAQVAAYEAARAGFAPGASAETVEAEARERLDLFGPRDALIRVTTDRFGPSAGEVSVRITMPIAANTWSLASRHESLVAEQTVCRRPR